MMKMQMAMMQQQQMQQQQAAQQRNKILLFAGLGVGALGLVYLILKR
jgi:hypothetical protein